MTDHEKSQTAYMAARETWTDQIGLDIQGRHAAAAKLLAAQGIDLTDTGKVAAARRAAELAPVSDTQIQTDIPARQSR